MVLAGALNESRQNIESFINVVTYIIICISRREKKAIK